MVTPVLASLASHLLEVASDGREPAIVAKALTTLHALVFFDLLPPAERPRVVALARARVADTHDPAVWLAAVELAVATGDDQLRSMVAAVSAGAVVPALLGELDLHLFVRSAAQRALDHAGDWWRVPGRRAARQAILKAKEPAEDAAVAAEN